MELGRGRQHLGLDVVPQGDGHGDELLAALHDLRGKVVRREPSSNDVSKDVVDRRRGWLWDVEDAEMPLQPVWNVILSTPWLVHRSQKVRVHIVLHVSNRLLDVIHGLLLQQLPDNLVGDLVSPLVDVRHGDVVHEDDHLLTARRAVDLALPLLHAALNKELEDGGRGQATHGDSLVLDLVHGELGHELVHSHRLGGTREANQQGGLVQRVVEVQERLKADRVQGWDDQGPPLGVLLLSGVGPIGQNPLPVRPLRVLLVDIVLVQRLVIVALLWQVVTQCAQHGVQPEPLLLVKQASEGPGHAVQEYPLVVALGQNLVLRLGLLQGSGKEVQQGLQLADVLIVHHLLGVEPEVLESLRDVLGEARPDRLHLGLAPLGEPGLHHRLPPKLRVGDIDDSSAAHGGQGRVVQVLRLEDGLHGVGHLDPVAVGQGQDLVVVEHRVQVLDPDGVHWSVQHDPRVLALALGGPPPEHGEDSIRPVPGRGVQPSEHLRRGDRLWVHPPDNVLSVEHRQRLSEALGDGGLSSSRWAHEHDPVPHQVGLVQLDALVEPGAVLLQALPLRNLAQSLVDVRELGPGRLEADEEVV